MKLVVLCQYNPWVISNAGSNRLLSLLNGLNNLDININLLIYGGYLFESEKDVFKFKGLKNCICYEYIFPYRHKNKLITFFMQYLAHVFLVNMFFNKIIKLLNNRDIVWVDNSIFGIKIAYKLKKNKRINVLTFTEINEFLDFYNFHKVHLIQRLYDKYRINFLEKKFSSIFDGVALMTNVLYKYYMNLNFEKKVKLIHLPMTVDLDRFNNVTDCGLKLLKPYLLYVGSLNDNKEGISYLINAFSKLNIIYKEYNLYLIGSYHPHVKDYKKLISSLKLESKIFILDNIDKDCIPYLMKNAVLLLLPRPNTKQSVGGFPTKLGEYLASCVPVCCTKVGEIPIYLEDNISIFFSEPNDVNSFYECMRRALSNFEFSKNVAIKGYEICNIYFNNKIQSSNLYNFFQNLLKNSY